MAKLSGFEFLPLEMTKKGAVHDAAQKAAILAKVRETGTGRITNLIVLSHGWNNDMAEARALYQELLANMAGLNAAPQDLTKTTAVVGVFWPSKKFADEDLIPAGLAAGAGGTASSKKRGVTAAALKQKLEGLKGTFDKADKTALEKAKKLVDLLDDSPKAQKEFVKLIRALLPPSSENSDASKQFFKVKPTALLESLSAPIVEPKKAPKGTGGIASTSAGTTGGVLGFQDILSGITAGAWRFLNFATFYQMKERAGVVGSGLNKVLKEVRAARPDLRIHLAGHSFGARLVTAAVAGPAKIAPSSMTLLQGAFSHNGFTSKFDGKKDGFFRSVIKENRVAGPILITHTVNDKAVGLAYPLAVRISGDNSRGLGDRNDTYGGMGRNGAVKMAPVEFAELTLLPVGGVYNFAPGKVHNLKADAFVSSHSAVRGRECAYALLVAGGF